MKANRRGGFMGKAWDSQVPGVDYWAPVLRVLSPGGYMLAFGGTRTYHRLACAIEDAGFEIRDCLMWLYGTGFPKGQGCLKPAWEPILLARKPGKRVLPLQVDACRVPTPPRTTHRDGNRQGNRSGAVAYGEFAPGFANDGAAGRYPANVLHDGSDEVLEAFAAFGESMSRSGGKAGATVLGVMNDDSWKPKEIERGGHNDAGTAARFFYCAKASKSERGEGNTHPTVKPLALMRWLVRLITPSGGSTLDPFGGSGPTAVAALHEGMRCLIVERDPAYCDIIRRRVAEAQGVGKGSYLTAQAGLFDEEL